jgi:hypothetical protein
MIYMRFPKNEVDNGSVDLVFEDFEDEVDDGSVYLVFKNFEGELDDGSKV